MDKIPCLVLLLLSAWERSLVSSQSTQTQHCIGAGRCPQSPTDPGHLDYTLYELAEAQGNLKAQLKLMADELRELRVGSDCVLGPFGGNGGGEVSDYEYSKHGNITGFQVSVFQSGDHIAGFAFSYGGAETPMRGDTYEITRVVLAADERITKVEGIQRAGTATVNSIWIVTALRFSSNKGNTYGWYGRPDQGNYFRVEGGFLRYVSGKFGGLIDQLNFHFAGCKP